MSWFGRFGRRRNKKQTGRGGAPLDRGATRADVEHLAEFARSRRGVEAYVEPQTMATQSTVVLIAADGEWTRRRVGGPEVGWRLAAKWKIPVYDAGIVGYPQRMRDYNARHKDDRPAL